MNINCIAIDDEPLALELIEDYCTKIPYLNFVKSFPKALEGIEFAKQENIDLIFMDIEMPELTGIQALEILKPEQKIIFITAYDNYAVKSYELSACDYILKPVGFPRFLEAVEKIKISLSVIPQKLPEIPTSESNNSFFFVKTENRMQRVNFSEILYIEGLKDYLIIQCKSEKVLCLQNFKKMEEALPESNFLRVHRSYIVALDKINSIERKRIYVGNKIIPIGDTYRKLFNEKIQDLSLEK